MIGARMDISFVPESSLLIFIRVHEQVKDTRLAKGMYLCLCGKEHIALISNVRTGKTLSCGCHKSATKSQLTHGYSRHPLYSVWENMYSRCYNKKVEAYKNYGGRGVIMCDEWKNSPEAFIEWGLSNGWKPGMQLDKDTSGQLVYSPSACVFITPKENSNNRRSNRVIQFNGETKTMAQWADRIGVSHSTMLYRLRKWSLERALNTSKDQKKFLL